MTSPAPSRRTTAPGDPADAVAALFDAHCDFTCRVLRHYGVHDSALDDAVQDVFVTAYRRWSTFEGRSSARSWLYGIARRIAFRYRRSADTRARRLATDDASPDGIDEPFDRVHAAQSLATLLGRIDRDKRAVFVLSELEGMTAPEVSDALGIPVGTVYSRLRAAWSGLGREAERDRRRLRRRLATVQPPGPSEARRRRMWGLVAGGLAPRSAPPAIAGTGVWTTAKWLVVGAAVGTGLWGARTLVGTSPASKPAPVVAAAAPRTPSPAPEPEVTLGTPTEAVPPTIESPAPSLAAPPPPTKASPRPHARRSTSPSAKSTAPSPDTLTAELSLVQRARRATSEGRGLAALALLDEHERRYPRGQLADERRVARIDALCAADRRPEAAQLARTLGRDPTGACPPAPSR